MEPVYAFMNTLVGTTPDTIARPCSRLINRDMYVDNASFTGATGTGFGLHSARPATCTAGPGGSYGASPTGSYGVAYWETDTNSLFVCTATNTWTFVYTPYTYPHPLDGGTPTANAPTFSPSSGAPPQTVTMSCSTAGSVGCYTVNGSTPGASTPGTCNASPTFTYSTPISITVNPTTLNGICTKATYLNSPLASSTYGGPPPTCGDPTQSGPNFSGTYGAPPTTLPLAIGFTSPTAGCSMFMTLNGSTPTCSSTAYAGQNITDTTTMRVIACQGGYTSSSVVGGLWTITFTLSPATAGTGSGTIVCTPSGAGITSGTPYSCTLTPAAGSVVGSVSGCGGSGTTTYTGPMPANSYLHDYRDLSGYSGCSYLLPYPRTLRIDTECDVG